MKKFLLVLLLIAIILPSPHAENGFPITNPRFQTV